MKQKKTALEKGANMRSEHDEMGSYTGIYSPDKYEKPIQDADDL